MAERLLSDSALNEFNFVTLWSVDEGETSAAICLHRGSVRERESQTLKVLAKGFEAVDDKGQVGEVLLHFHSAAVGEVTQLDEFVAFWSLEEHQLGSPLHFPHRETFHNRRLVPMHKLLPCLYGLFVEYVH